MRQKKRCEFLFPHIPIWIMGPLSVEFATTKVPSYHAKWETVDKSNILFNIIFYRLRLLQISPEIKPNF